MSRLLNPWIVSVFLCAAANAQDQAERLLDNADTFMNAGKYKEALTDLESVLANFGQTPWAPKALLKTGLYHLQVEQDYGQASTYFGRIQSEYPQSNEAPAAYYYNAFIVERRGSSAAELEAAVADLIRMRNLFPANPWRSGAAFLFGKLTLRLQNYDESLNQLQSLEFEFPNSEYLPQALLLSAQAAYLRGAGNQAALILARLQSKFPDSAQAARAASYLRLLSRFTDTTSQYELDPTFFGASPKKYANPSIIRISETGVIAIKDSRNVYFESMDPSFQRGIVSTRDLVDFAVDRNGGVLMVYENRLSSRENGAVFGSLSSPEGAVRKIKSAAIDGFGRLHIVDDGAKDVLVFNRDGQYIKRLGANRPQLVRCFIHECWVAGSDTLRVFDGALNSKGSPISGLKDIVDFCFDPFGNLYVLSDRGARASIYARNGQQRASMNFKSGSFPLRQAQGIAVDATGAVYFSDRRGGAVYRYQ